LKRASWVTWRLFFITLPVDVFAIVFLSKIALLSLENAPVSILVGLMAHFALAPFFALGIQISARFNSWKSDLPILVSLGAIRGVVIVLCGRLFDLPNVVSDEFRVFNSAMAFPTWFIFFTIAIEARHQYQREFDQLFHKVVKEGEGRKPSKTPGVEDMTIAEEAISRVQSLSSKLGAEIQLSLAKSGTNVDYEYESKQIQDLIQMELRPASKQLWQGKFISSPQIFKYDLLRIVLLEQKLPIAFVLLCSAPFLFVGITGAYGILAAAVQTSAATIPVFLIYLGFEKCYKLKVTTRFQSNLATLALSYLTPVLAQYFLIPPSLRLATNPNSYFLFQFALWFVLLGLLIGYNLFNSLAQQRLAVLASFKSLLSDSRYLELMASESNSLSGMQMSRYLHGEVQSGLTASILLLQQAAKRGDTVLAREAMESAVKILMRNHMEDFNKTQMSTDAHLAQIISGWRGLADVSIILDCIDLLDEATKRDVVELIGEGVANAIRHGKATQISVTDIEELEEIRVSIHSNGPESPQGESGVGTEMFNRLTNSWGFENRDGQGVLTFTVSQK
jgi:signal transduction histidine kinase